MKMKTKLKHLPIAAFAATALALAGCGGGGSDPTMSMMDDTPAPVQLTLAALLAGDEVEAGTYTFSAEDLAVLVAAGIGDIEPPADGYAPGDMLSIAGVVLTCSGDVNCSVTVNDDGSITTMGTIMTAMAMVAPPDPTPTPATYEMAKAAYDADMTQANLDALTGAAMAALTAATANLETASTGTAAELLAAQAALADAQANSAAVHTIVTDLMTGIDTAIGNYNVAKTAHMVAKDAYDEDMSLANANALKTAADDLHAKATAAHTAGGLGASEAHTMALAEISVPDAAAAAGTADAAVVTAQAAVDAAAVAAATKAAGTKVKAINAEARQDTDAGIGGDVATGETTTYSMDISRDRDGTTIKIADTDVAGEDDPKFTQYMDLGGGRTMHVRTMDADDEGNVEEEVVVVSTDIEAPKATAFAKVAGQTLNVNTNTMNDSPAETFEALTVLGANIGEVKSDAFAAGTAAVLTFVRYQLDSDGSVDGNQTIEAFEAAGTYNGAMGTYKCNDDAADCTATVNAKGAITAMSDGWIFTPDAGATSDVVDAEYLSYGFWLKRTTDADGAVTYDEVETFAAVEGIEETDTGFDEVAGTATYSGGAVGVYVKNVLDNQANITTATSGHFKADVELNASFGGGDVSANNQFTIDGTITDFVLSGGEENDWAVGLGLTDLSGRADNDPGKSGPGTNHAGAFSGVATGDSTAAAGKWNGVFYGSSADFDHDDDNTTPDINPQPVAVTGEFNANFTDGTTAGAFGTTKE